MFRSNVISRDAWNSFISFNLFEFLVDVVVISFFFLFFDIVAEAEEYAKYNKTRLRVKILRHVVRDPCDKSGWIDNYCYY